MATYTQTELRNMQRVLALDTALNNRNFNAIPPLFDPNYIWHGTLQGSMNRQGVIRMLTATLTAFSNFRQAQKKIFADGNWVGVFYELSGTFDGQVQGWPAPTGRRFKVQSAVKTRFNATGQQREAWGYVDNLSWFLQIGAILQ